MDKKNLPTVLGKGRQYIIIQYISKNGNGNINYYLRKVSNTTKIVIDTENYKCLNFTEPIGDDCTGVTLTNVVAYTHNGEVFNCNTPLYQEVVTEFLTRLKKIAPVINKELEEHNKKVKVYIQKHSLDSHSTCINSEERQITIESYKCTENLIKAQAICERFNRYSMCVYCYATILNHSVQMFFQF